MKRHLVVALAIVTVAGAARADDWWGPDKALHLGATVAAASVGYGVTSALSDSRADRVVAGLVVGMGAGVFKELIDVLGFGTPSVRDLAWDLVGTVLGTALSWVLERWLITPWLEALAPRFAG